MYCSQCGKEIPENSQFCENCGEKNNKDTQKKNPFMGCLSIIGSIFLFFIILGIFMGGNETITNTTMQNIENKVATDAVEQYNIAKQQGDKIQTCVQAGLVSAAYLQAKDQENYNEWKIIEKKDCNIAGIGS